MMREFEIERQFDIKIKSIKASKGIYHLKTDKGDKCLKKINYPVDKLLFVHGAKEHLIENGFNYVDKCLLNVDEEPFAYVNEDIYTLSNWLEGRECDFHNLDEIKNATKVLANLHIASKGYEPSEEATIKSDLGLWPSLMEKRTRSFNKMRDKARKKNNKSEFDLLFLKSLDFYRDCARKALSNIQNSEYHNLCKLAEDEKSFCHHDFTYHNIVIDNSNNINVIDFDYCKREIRAFDIANFMTKVLKRNDWDINLAKDILNAYNEVEKISDDEKKVLYSYLLFPQRYWRLANRYYYNEVTFGQNTFATKLQSIIDEKEKFVDFSSKFLEI